MGTLTVMLLMVVGTAYAEFCGENGVIRFSFTREGELQSVATAEPSAGNLTIVELFAFLDEVEPVQYNGDAFLAVGGFEMKLVIEGAEGDILEQGFPGKIMNVGPENGWCLVGIDGSEKIENGRAFLARWKIAFVGEPKNVRFSLDPEGLVSCRAREDCAATGTQGLYVGSASSKQLDLIVGTGCAPAYLNWEGEPDLTPIHSNIHWTEAGVLDPRQ